MRGHDHPSPTRLWIVRHGESAGNVARDQAEAAGSPRIVLASRDMDLPLSPRGQAQAEALGRSLAAEPVAQRPTVVISSPYARAIATAEVALPQVPILLDERLRERELGVIGGLTRLGIETEFAQEAAQMTLLGKFYHRPPGGESWCDVVLRVRSFYDSLRSDHDGESVLIVCHAVVVLCLRYVLERLSETQLLAIDAHDPVINGAATCYRRDPASTRAAMSLVGYNCHQHLLEAGQASTTRADRPVGAG